MSAVLSLQDPAAPGGHLLEALLDACQGAREGGAFFSFATADGVRLLFVSEEFHRFLTRADSFELVVGLDAITDVAALEAIEAVDVEHLRARAFLHDRRPLLFHPKLAWFRNADRTTLVLGSGNLTRGGLRSNWEAFSVIELRGREARSVHETLQSWLSRWDVQLLALDDPAVRERAARNKGRERDLQVPAPDEIGRDLEIQELRTYEPGEPVLVAELSKSRGGGRQANFHSEHYKGYFGASQEARRQLVFREIEADGTSAADETRHSVTVKSRNYRVELNGLKRQEYPTGDLVPIAVFVETAGGMFLYRVLWPDDEPGHSALDALLGSKVGRRVGRSRMRQVRSTVDELADAWPENPLLQAIPGG